MHITDTTGTQQFPAMQRLSISRGHAFVLVFSVTSKQSLEELKNILEIVGDVSTTHYEQFDHSKSGWLHTTSFLVCSFFKIGSLYCILKNRSQNELNDSNELV